MTFEMTLTRYWGRFPTIYPQNCIYYRGNDKKIVIIASNRYSDSNWREVVLFANFAPFQLNSL